jgi:hypothetical protein
MTQMESLFKNFRTKTMAALLVMVFLFPGRVGADGIDSLGEIYRWTGYGTYLSFASPSGNPSNMVVSGMPPGAVIQQAYLWAYQGEGSGNSNFDTDFNGSTVTGAMIGTTTCPGGCWHMEQVRWDVTALVSGANTSYTIDNHANVYNGFQLTLVFVDPAATCRTTVIIADGNNPWHYNSAFSSTPLTLDWSAESNPVDNPPQLKATWGGTTGGLDDPSDTDYNRVLADDLVTDLWASPFPAWDNDDGDSVDVDTYDLSGAVVPGQTHINVSTGGEDEGTGHWGTFALATTACESMTIVKSINKTTFSFGETVTYCLAWEAVGGGGSRPVSVWDTLDPVLTYIGSDAPGVMAPSGNGDFVSWDLGSQSGGATGTVCVWAEITTMP